MTVKGQFEQAAPAVLLKAVSGNKLAVEIVHCPQPHTPFPRLALFRESILLLSCIQTCSVLAGPIMHALFCFVPSFVLLAWWNTNSVDFCEVASSCQCLLRLAVTVGKRDSVPLFAPPASLYPSSLPSLGRCLDDYKVLNKLSVSPRLTPLKLCHSFCILVIR